MDEVINVRIYLQSSYQAITDRRKERARRKYKNLNEKSIFHYFLRLSFGEEKKISEHKL